MNVFRKMFTGDKVIWCIFIALCFFSLLEVFSATSTLAYRQQNHWGPIGRHAMFLFFGFGAVLLLQRVPIRFFSASLALLPIAIVLLFITLLVGSDVNGAQRWIGIGAFTIQPSELAKIALVCFVAFTLSRMKPDNENTAFKVLIFAISLVCGLIAPENLSTALLIFIVCFLMLFIGQVKIRKLALVALVVGGLAFLFVASIALLPPTVIKDSFPDRVSTWKARIDRHSQPNELEEDGTAGSYKITDENFQVAHAKIAIANGGIIGLPGSGVERDILPQAYSDFIFAIILEEMGLLGGLIVLFLYLALMVRAGILAAKCEKKFPRYLILGAALMLTIQALLNMAVAVNLIPVTGQPLPLISRGGTSTIITCIYFGIILACSSISNSEGHEDVDESIANIDFETSIETNA